MVNSETLKQNMEIWWKKLDNPMTIAASVEDINTSGVEFLVRAKNNGRRGVKATHVEFELRKRTSYKETEFDVVEHPEWIHQLI